MMDERDQNADFDARMEDLRQRHADRLAAGVALVVGSSQLLAKDEDVEVRGALRSLVGGRHVFDVASSPEKAFENLREWAGRAFSESPTDAEILASSATPDLVRYLLAALRAYDGMPANLATAFKAKGQAKGTGRTTEVWRLRAAIIAAADEEHEKQKQSRAPRGASRRAVEDAAFEKFVSVKRHKIRPDTRSEAAFRREIRSLLNEFYGWE